MKAVIVGAGGMGRAITKSLREVEGFKVVGIVELFEDRREDFASEFQNTGFANLVSAFETTKPDLVVVATQHRTHAAVCLEAISLGAKAVYCEKPMTVSLGEDQAIRSAAESAGTIVAVNHQRRLLPELQKMREIIASGEIGEVYLARASNGGDVLSDGTHAIDSLRFLLGAPKPKECLLKFFERNRTRKNRKVKVSSQVVDFETVFPPKMGRSLPFGLKVPSEPSCSPVPNCYQSDIIKTMKSSDRKIESGGNGTANRTDFSCKSKDQTGSIFPPKKQTESISACNTF